MKTILREQIVIRIKKKNLKHVSHEFLKIFFGDVPNANIEQTSNRIQSQRNKHVKILPEETISCRIPPVIFT